MTNTENMRKAIDVLKGTVKASKTVIKEHDYSDITSPNVDETKVEISFKGDDHIDVNVHAETTDDLKRLMDLAGMYHSEKTGTIDDIPVVDPLANRPEHDPLGAGQLGMEPEMDTAMDMEPEMDVLDMPMDDMPIGDDEVNASALGTIAGGVAGGMLGGPLGAITGAAAGDSLTDSTEPKLGIVIGETEITPDMHTDLIGKTFVSRDGVKASILDIDDDRHGEPIMFVKWATGHDASYPVSMLAGARIVDEMQDTVDDVDEAIVSDVTAGANNDFGHPNPLAGKQQFDLTAHSFSGHGSKDVRYVPANSGDNAMDDAQNPKASAIRVKGLKEFIEDVTLSEKKSPEEVVAAAKAQIPTPLNQITQQKLDNATGKLTNKPGAVNLDTAEMINNVAGDLDPRAADQLKKGYDDAMASGELEENDLNWDDFFDNDRESGCTDDEAYNERQACKHQDHEEEMGMLGDIEVDDDLEEARYKHQYSFRNSIMPFQNLTGSQKLSRKAMSAIKKRRT